MEIQSLPVMCSMIMDKSAVRAKPAKKNKSAMLMSSTNRVFTCEQRLSDDFPSHPTESTVTATPTLGAIGGLFTHTRTLE